MRGAIIDRSFLTVTEGRQGITLATVIFKPYPWQSFQTLLKPSDPDPLQWNNAHNIGVRPQLLDNTPSEGAILRLRFNK